MSEFTKMASGGMLKKQVTLLQLVEKARHFEKSKITADEIIQAYECEDINPVRRKEFFPTHRKSNVARTASNQYEQQLAKDLHRLETFKLPDGRPLRILYYQCPLKSALADKGVGKIDLIGCVDKQSLALIELKTKDSTENPRRALLEIMAYGAIVRANIGAITSELTTKFGLELSEGVQLIVLAPEAYWDRWRTEKRRIERWKEFCGLCRTLRDGPHKFDIQCLAFEKQDLRSLLTVFI